MQSEWQKDSDCSVLHVQFSHPGVSSGKQKRKPWKPSDRGGKVSEPLSTVLFSSLSIGMVIDSDCLKMCNIFSFSFHYFSLYIYYKCFINYFMWSMLSPFSNLFSWNILLKYISGAFSSLTSLTVSPDLFFHLATGLSFGPSPGRWMKTKWRLAVVFGSLRCSELKAAVKSVSL